MKTVRECLLDGEKQLDGLRNQAQEEAKTQAHKALMTGDDKARQLAFRMDGSAEAYAHAMRIINNMRFAVERGDMK